MPAASVTTGADVRISHLRSKETCFQTSNWIDDASFARHVDRLKAPMSPPPSHEVKRPVAQVYNPGAGDKAPLAALLTALARAPGQIPGGSGIGPQIEGAAAFTARLCSALNLQTDSLLSNIQSNKSAQVWLSHLIPTP